ncbi:MAG: YkvA family protein [Candidatus Heimdallarchaeaceae archaeon]
MKIFKNWKKWVTKVKNDSYALYLAYKDPRVSWFARIFAFLVIAYFFSPIDLIPDFIPIFGYLDDFVLVPVGLVLALKMMPKDVLAESREKAKELTNLEKPKSWIIAVIIVIIWVTVISSMIFFIVVKFF